MYIIHYSISLAPQTHMHSLRKTYYSSLLPPALTANESGFFCFIFYFFLFISSSLKHHLSFYFLYSVFPLAPLRSPYSILYNFFPSVPTNLVDNIEENPFRWYESSSMEFEHLRVFLHCSANRSPATTFFSCAN